MQQLFILAENEKIVVEYLRLKSPIKGFYCKEPGCFPFIGLDHSLHSDLRLHRCVMAEEIGHHFTSSGEPVVKRRFSSSDRLSIDKIEYKALRWAANYLVPENNLLDALRDGLCEVWELAEEFDVTEEMMRFRLRLWGVKNMGVIL